MGQPRPMSDSGDSRDEINAKGMERDVMPAVRPTIPPTPEMELKIPFRIYSALTMRKISKH